jgi:hypothetical protein
LLAAHTACARKGETVRKRTHSARTLMAMTVALMPPLWAAGQEPLAVHFTPGVAHPVTREEDKRLEDVFRAAQKTVQELETSLKKQHGKNQGWGGAEAAAEVAMRVAPGSRLSSDTLTQSGASFRAKKSLMSRGGAFTIHDFSKDAPYWLLVSRKPIVGFSFPWKGAAGQAIDAFERFSAENADKLTAARSARK